MLLRAQPIFDAFDAIEKKNPRVILLDPAGKKFDQAYAEDLAQEEELIFICGHYEGYDERIKTLVTDEVSLGDYVLTGGELAAMTMIDATVRLIPEVIGKESSHQDDSFSFWASRISSVHTSLRLSRHGCPRCSDERAP